MQTLILDYQNKQLLCIGLTVTYENVTLVLKKNTIKILAKLYESATSHSISYWEFKDQMANSVDLDKVAHYKPLIKIYHVCRFSYFRL